MQIKLTFELAMSLIGVVAFSSFFIFVEQLNNTIMQTSITTVKSILKVLFVSVTVGVALVWRKWSQLRLT